MKYEIVTLEEKIAVGISARTNNRNPDIGLLLADYGNDFTKKAYIQPFLIKWTEKPLAFIQTMQGMKHQIIQQWLLVKQQKSQPKACVQFAGFQQAGTQNLLFTEIWCRLLRRHGRKSGRWICQGHFSVILRNIRMTVWRMQKSIFM